MTDEARIVEDLRWFASYYPDWDNENPRETMEKAADTIEIMMNVLDAKDRMLAAMDYAVANLEKKVAKVKRERDALRNDLMLVAGDTSFCEICKQYEEAPCRGMNEPYCFEWRGVQGE